MEMLLLNYLAKQNNQVEECLRGIRTNIQFCGTEIKSILITSTTPDEGKSSVTVELARSFAKSGKRVLIIDTDMRKTVMKNRYKIKTESGTPVKGLSHYLSGQTSADSILYQTNIPNMFMICAGQMVPNATEILDSKRFNNLMNASAEHFDYVLVDTAPLTAAIDSSVVAKRCDGAIMVIEPEANPTRIIQASKKQLEASGVRILGVVLNKVKASKNMYGKYYGAYYGKYYGNE